MTQSAETDHEGDNSCTLTHSLSLSSMQYARTELIKNNLNPEFSKAIELDYRFEEVQKLKFSVYDLDNDTSSLSDDDFLGGLECTLGEVGGYCSG